MAKTLKKSEPLFEPGALDKALEAAWQIHQGQDSKLRKTILKILGGFREAGIAKAQAQLGSQRNAGLSTARKLSHLQDELIQALYRFVIRRIFRTGSPTKAEKLAIIATGGYGRGALAPYSDIDLLFLLPYKQTSWGEQVVEYILYILWDLKLSVGQAVRSVDECIRLAREDFTIRTSVLEARHIIGDEELSAALDQRLWDELFKKTGQEFVEAKLAERDKRHLSLGDTRYVVEPNIKEGKGGLRDLQTLFWLGKYLYRTGDPDKLIAHGLFTKEECNKFISARKFLWSVRCNLHLLAGRAEERLSFDVQIEMAARLGYKERKGANAVERFMKHYFLNAKDVGDLTRIFCAALEERNKKKAPRLGRLLPGLFRRSSRQVEGFTVQGGRLDVEHEDMFEKDPVALIRLFHVADQSGLDIHPRALQLITRSLKLINADLRKNGDANRLFLEVLSSRHKPDIALRRMNEAGVLGRFIPDFGRIVALMQFNMYHHYTADEHLIRTIGVLSRIERQELVKDHPLSSRIINNVLSREVLYVALFLHDIAKGRPEDHSIAGARIANKLCPRLGMDRAQTDSVAWLVENHLVMSDYAQKRDVSDPQTVKDFAAIVQSPERLRLLLCLTVADIRGVGPGVWNGWKGELLRQLYFETEALLQGGHTQVSRKSRVQGAQEAFREKLPNWSGADLEAYINRFPDAYWLILDPDTQASHAALLAKSGGDVNTLGIDAAPDPWRDITRVTLTMPDHAGLFARVAGALSVAGLNIVDAKIFTTSDGIAVDSFWVQDSENRAVKEKTQLTRLKDNIRNALAGKFIVPEALKQRRKRKTRSQAFSVPPRVLIDNNASSAHTVIEINGRDRPGLIYDLARAIGRLNLSIASAHIATYGARAVDVFYVKDNFGLKITNDQRIKAIEAELKAAIPEPPAPTRKAAA